MPRRIHHLGIGGCWSQACRKAAHAGLARALYQILRSRRLLRSAKAKSRRAEVGGDRAKESGEAGRWQTTKMGTQGMSKKARILGPRNPRTLPEVPQGFSSVTQPLLACRNRASVCLRPQPSVQPLPDTRQEPVLRHIQRPSATRPYDGDDRKVDEGVEAARGKKPGRTAALYKAAQ